jgi:hypothetical protein
MKRQFFNTINIKNKKQVLNYMHGVIMYVDNPIDTKNIIKVESNSENNVNKNRKPKLTLEEELLLFYY